MSTQRATLSSPALVADPQHEDHAADDHVADEQWRMVLSHTRAGTLLATAFAVLMAVYVHGSTPAYLVQAWIFAKLLVAGLRIVLGHFHAKQNHPGEARWRRLSCTLLAMDGAVWGLAGLWMMSQPVSLASLVAAALAGVSCVATFGLQVRFTATAAYVIPILAPTSIGLVLRADGVGLIGGPGLMILLGLQLVTARAAQQRLAAGIQLRLQAQALAQEKDEALQLARQQSAAKARFLANISHELRTPLHGILGLARLLHVEARDAPARHRVELIEASGMHLLALINDLLDVARIESGRFSLRHERFDLVAQLSGVAELYAMRASDKGLAFELVNELESPTWVEGDAARLRQVLHNLLGNAIKFTQRGSIQLKLGRGMAHDEVRIEVIDSGIGIADEEQAHVFQAFRQAGADTEQSTSSGAGLGLTIAREIAQAMGGDITVSSRIGNGSSFVFTARLPAAPPGPAAPASDAPAVAAAGSGLRRVLVAEDDEVNAIIVAAYLEQLGFHCERVADGKQAGARALRETERPDLVLMDWRMPVMDGLRATREIRTQERTLGLQRVPVIALTATASADDRQQCIEAGMDDFIAKPFTRAELARVLERWSSKATRHLLRSANDVGP